MLRGTRKNQVSAAVYRQRPTLQNQITRLQAQVSQNKPETQYFRVSGNHTSSTTPGYTQHNYLVTQSLISSADFRNNVTGDIWANLYLKFKFAMEPDCKIARIICYVPKKAGTRFTPASYGTAVVVDPSSFWVIGDHYVTHEASSNRKDASTFNWNLKKLKTLYDSNAALIERGELVITVLSEPSTASTLQWTYGYQLTYHNK